MRAFIQQQVASQPASSQERSGPLSSSVWGREGVGDRDAVLRAFGLTASDRPQVLELGREAIEHDSADLEFEESDAEGA